MQQGTCAGFLPAMVMAATFAVGCTTESAETSRASSPAARGRHATTPLTSMTPALGASGAMADVAESVLASVVNISATRVDQGDLASEWQELQGSDHRFFFFGPDLFDPRPPRPEEHSMGSGVLVSKDGVILTNYHVIAAAEDIRVTLADGRELTAKVAGADPQSDLAVIRLDQEAKDDRDGNEGRDISDIRPLAFGDSSALRVGEVVLAVGNPFGVGQTVTMGIVSATGRGNLGILDYEDFIQTDAAINPGNSGGALVNTRGELVGISTAILSSTGGNHGVGFAIPSSMAKPIVASLLAEGKVTRGWLGIVIQELRPDLARALSLNSVQGALLTEIRPGSPAAAAGLVRGDVVVSVSGSAIDRPSKLRNMIASLAPGTEIELVYLRAGKRHTARATLGEAPQSESALPADTPRPASPLGGLRIADLTPAVRERYGVPETTQKGVLITAVEPDSAADRAGLFPGDIVLEADLKPLESVAMLNGIYRSAKGPIALVIERRRETTFFAVLPAPRK